MNADLYYTFTTPTVALAFTPDSFYTLYHRQGMRNFISGPVYRKEDTLVFTTSPYRSQEVVVIAKATYTQDQCHVHYVDPATALDYSWQAGTMPLWSALFSNGVYQTKLRYAQDGRAYYLRFSKQRHLVQVDSVGAL